MLARLKRIVVSLAVTIAAYFAYALLAVPFIEPGVASPGATAVAQHEIDHARESVLRKREKLAAWFRPGDWELADPIILESPQCKLLIRSYESGAEKSVLLRPCTLVFLPDDDGSPEAERNRRAVILQAPEGAELTFDEPIDLKQGRIGQLESGRLLGTFTVRSDQRAPGPEDDLLIVARDAELLGDRIESPHPVEFRLGNSHGRGSHLRIELTSRDAAPDDRGLRFTGIRSFELERDVAMHIDPRDPAAADGAADGAAQHGGVRSNAAAPAAVPAVAPDAAASAAAGQGESPSGAAAQTPLDIRCRGPFRFDLDPYVASFRETVDVVRIHPEGPGDMLRCEVLSVHFTNERPVVDERQAGSTDSADAASPADVANGGPAEADAGADAAVAASDAQARPLRATSSALPKLRPTRIEAQGNPVVIESPQNQVVARGERLEYDLDAGQITLEGRQRVRVEQGANVIEVPRLELVPDRTGRWGRFRADGAGWLDAARPEEPARRLRASWQDSATLAPHQDEQLISVMGAAHVDLGEMGTIDAAQIHIWLAERPRDERSRGALPQRPVPHPPVAQTGAPHSAPRSASLVPRRAMALGNVHITSAELTADVERLQVWFVGAASPGGHATSLARPDVLARDSETRRGKNLIYTSLSVPSGHALLAAHAADHGVSGLASAPPPRASTTRRAPALTEALPSDGHVAAYQPPASRPTDRLLAAAPSNANPTSPRRSHFAVTGQTLQLELLIEGDQTQVSAVNLEGQARIVETQTAEPGQQPLVLAGDRLQASGLAASAGLVTLTGKPARAEARGASVEGEQIWVRRPSGQTDVQGPGRLKLPADQNLDGRAMTTPARLEIEWQQSMRFDGLRAHFLGDVVCGLDQRQLRCPEMEVLLTAPIQLESANKGPRPEVAQVWCRGGVDLDGRLYEAGTLTATEQMHLIELTLNQQTGAITGEGPGWLTTVRLGLGDPLAPAARNPSSAPREPATTAATGLTYVHVDFQHGLGGNLHRRVLQFGNRVDVVYGPVARWDARLEADDLDDLAAGGDGQAMLLHCQRLTLAEMRYSEAAPPGLEVTAEGNTQVEGLNYQGQSFYALAERISYSQAKDLLVLEGDGRRDAELRRQTRPGAPVATAAARKIFFWRSSNRVDVEDARMLDLNVLSSGNRPAGTDPSDASPQLR